MTTVVVVPFQCIMATSRPVVACTQWHSYDDTVDVWHVLYVADGRWDWGSSAKSTRYSLAVHTTRYNTSYLFLLLLLFRKTRDRNIDLKSDKQVSAVLLSQPYTIINRANVQQTSSLILHRAACLSYISLPCSPDTCHIYHTPASLVASCKRCYN